MPRRRTPAVDPHLAVLYVVTGPDHDAEAAEDRLRAWWSSGGGDLTVAHVVHEEDALLIPLADREGFRGALLALADHGAGVLVAGRVADLGGDVELALAVALVRMQGASLELADEPGWASRPVAVNAGELVEMLVSYEATARGARLRHGLELKRRKGEYRGGAVPYGWRVGAGGDLVEHSHEQIAVEQMIRLRREGMSYAAIAEALAADGFRPRSGREGVAPDRDSGRWHPKTVAALIHRALANRGQER